MGMLLRQYHPQPEAEAEAADSKPLDRQNKAELQETARTLGVSDEGTNAELRDRIKAKRSEAAESPEGPEPEGEPEGEPEDADPAEPENEQPDNG